MIHQKKLLILAENHREYYPALPRFVDIDEHVHHASPRSFDPHAANGSYDIILLDFGFDLEHGLSVLEAIKKAAPQSIVILIGNTESKDGILRAFRLGARDYHDKPADPDVLQRLIAFLSSLRRQNTEARPSLSPVVSRLTTSSETGQNGKNHDLVHVFDHIDRNIMRDLHTEDLARMANLSIYHFIRKFKKLTGMTPKRYVLLKKMDNAKRLIRQKNAHISEVSSIIGYNDLSNFSKIFKKYTGFTPIEFRRIS